MSQIEVFNNEEFGSIRVIEENGKYLFCGLDAAKALGYRTASGNVLPYAKPSNDGLFCVKDYCNHGHFGSYTLVTPQGKLYFAQLRDSILVMI